MRTNPMEHHIRRTRIYKGLYRPSSNLSRFIGTILSILLQGHSQVDSSRPRIRP